MQHNKKQFRKVHISAHFHDRLMERRGHVLTKQESLELEREIISQLCKPENAWISDEESVEFVCNVYGKRFVAVFVPETSSIVTCMHPNNSVGYKKFMKKVLPTLLVRPQEDSKQIEAREEAAKHARIRRNQKPKSFMKW